MLKKQRYLTPFSDTNFIALLALLLLGVFGCSTCKKSTSIGQYQGHVISYQKEDSVTINDNGIKKNYHQLQIEFGKKLTVAPDSIFNLRLYGFIKRWLGTPYQWGGTDASGIDSNFTSMFMM
jgi:hypothetical protein